VSRVPMVVRAKLGDRAYRHRRRHRATIHGGECGIYAEDNIPQPIPAQRSFALPFRVPHATPIDAAPLRTALRTDPRFRSRVFFRPFVRSKEKGRKHARNSFSVGTATETNPFSCARWDLSGRVLDGVVHVRSMHGVSLSWADPRIDPRPVGMVR
jgi:hypothetical protein